MLLSSMADTKANIIITVSSIVLTLSLGRASDPALRVAVLILRSSLLALLLAILAVLPKYRPLRLGGDELPPYFNLLFFGHFAELSRERYWPRWRGSSNPTARSYATQASDLYSLGVYLARHKYRYLRFSHLFFLMGFVLVRGEQAVRLLLH